jgi:YfiH family protein
MSSCFFTFGNAHESLETFQVRYPHFTFRILNQTHSNNVVEAPDNGLAMGADAQFTFKKNEALCIRTADCLPILICAGSAAAAIHAGWRGLETNIIAKTLTALNKRGCSTQQMKVWIGPHIGPQSFEVGVDVAQKLQSCFDNTGFKFGAAPNQELLVQHQNPEKKFVNLELLARAQLWSCGLSTPQIQLNEVDTFKSEHHHSYRRDSQRAGRQISFICLEGS